MSITCINCGVGTLTGVPSALKKAVRKRDGFRDEVVYFHKSPGVCDVVLRVKAQHEAEELKRIREHNRLHRRIARAIARIAGFARG